MSKLSLLKIRLSIEHIGNSVHTTEFLALVKAVNIFINYLIIYPVDNMWNESTSGILKFTVTILRSSHQRRSIKKTVLNLKICNIHHKKTPVLESLFNKAAERKACSMIKKRLKHRCFPGNIAKSLRTSVLKIIYKRLLPNLEVFCARNLLILAMRMLHLTY